LGETGPGLSATDLQSSGRARIDETEAPGKRPVSWRSPLGLREAEQPPENPLRNSSAGCGETRLLRRLQDELVREGKVLISKSLAVVFAFAALGAGGAIISAGCSPPVLPRVWPPAT
jgi:hypothetical protein